VGYTPICTKRSSGTAGLTCQRLYSPTSEAE
jgi:hypothetical protein